MGKMVETRSDPIALVFGSDNNYAIPLTVALYSVLSNLNHGSYLYLFIIDGGISDINKKRIDRVIKNIRNNININFNWIKSDLSSLSDLKIAGHITTATYFSLLVPNVIPEQFNKAIFLDCDILVENDLNKLWQENIGDNALLAVRDYLIPTLSSPGGLAKYKELGLPPQSPYFNAGVLVMNLEVWRAEELSSLAFSYLREYVEHLNFRDQEGLNAVLVDKWKQLDPRWNVATSILSHERWAPSEYKDEIGLIKNDLISSPYIWHFIGPNKPWHLNLTHPARGIWHHYFKKINWFTPLGTKQTKVRYLKDTNDQTIVKTMPETKVAIKIPTFNRSELLKVCLDSVLKQEYSGFQVVVLDDASADDTEALVRSFNDSRVTYRRNELHTGLFGNWERALETDRCSYLTILPDDDLMMPGFIGKSIKALEKNEKVALSAGRAKYIDIDGKSLNLKNSREMPEGVIYGLDYLHSLVEGRMWVPHMATIMFRSSALEKVGSFRATHAKQLLDLNLFIRLASHFDMVVNCEQLAKVRIHAEQGKNIEFKSLKGTKKLSTLAERIDAAIFLLNSKRSKNIQYREWLVERLFFLNQQRSKIICHLLPGLEFTWAEQKKIEDQFITEVISSGEKFFLIDGNITMQEYVSGRHAIPFIEKNGLFWEDPLDDEIAINEVERNRCKGINFIVFSSPAFWWFDHYSRFFSYLQSNYNCVIKNKWLVVFDLKRKKSKVSGGH